MNKIERALEILMEEKNLFWCKECEEWVWNVDKHYPFDYCEKCLEKNDEERR